MALAGEIPMTAPIGNAICALDRPPDGASIGARGRPVTTTRGQPVTAAALAAVTRAAFELDRDTRALAGAHLALDRELARGLVRVWDQELFRPLGYARAIDYAYDQLGLKEGKARQLLKLGRALGAVPELERAWAQGHLHASKVGPLMRVLGAESAAAERRVWIERAAGCSVTELGAAVRAELERRRVEAPQVTTPAPAGATADNTVTAPSDAAPHVVAASSSLEAQLRPGLNLLDPDAPAEGDWMSVPVPARTSELWAVAVESARRAAGREAPLHQCAEWIAADYLARVGDEDPADTQRHEAEFRRQRGVAALSRLMNQKPRRQSLLDIIVASGLDYSFLPAPGDGAPQPCASPPSESTETDTRAAAGAHAPPAPVLGPEERVGSTGDPFELAAVLARLITRKRRLRLELGRHLDRLEHTRAWEHLGARSYDQYCADRLGFTRRHAESLSAFSRALRRFRLLRRAYLDGSLGYTATRSLLRVVHPSTEPLWVAWARALSARDIERTVEHAALYMLPGADPAILRTYAQCVADTTAANAFAAEPRDRRRRAPAITNALAAADMLTAAAPPLGWPLPPLSRRQPPRIRGLDYALPLLPDRPVARIRFWAPHDVLSLLRRALRRCRQILAPHAHTDSPPDSAFLEVLLVHFILEHDSPAARRHHRLHPIVRRDRHRCAVPGCTSRQHLEVHHLWFRSRGGPHARWNLVTLCRAHHALLHQGTIEIGGWAPWALSFRLGIHPLTRHALVSYTNGRRASEHQVRAAIDRWHTWCRTHQHLATEQLAA